MNDEIFKTNAFTLTPEVKRIIQEVNIANGNIGLSATIRMIVLQWAKANNWKLGDQEIPENGGGSNAQSQ